MSCGPWPMVPILLIMYLVYLCMYIRKLSFIIYFLYSWLLYPLNPTSLFNPSFHCIRVFLFSTWFEFTAVCAPSSYSCTLFQHIFQLAYCLTFSRFWFQVHFLASIQCWNLISGFPCHCLLPIFPFPFFIHIAPIHIFPIHLFPGLFAFYRSLYPKPPMNG